MPRGKREYDQGIFAVAAGEPGAGKSTLAAYYIKWLAANDLPGTVYYVDLDRQADTLLEVLTEDEAERLWWTRLPGNFKLDEATGLYVPKGNRPDAWNGLMELASRFQDFHTGELAPPYKEWTPYDMLFIDGHSSLFPLAFQKAQASSGARVSEAHAIHHNVKEKDPMARVMFGRHRQIDDWMRAADIVDSFYIRLRDITPRHFNVVTCVHLVRPEYDIEKIVSLDTLQKAVHDPAAREQTGRTTVGRRVALDKMVPESGVGMKYNHRFHGRFNYILPVERGSAGDINVYIHAAAGFCDPRVPDTQHRLPDLLKGRDALATLVQHHISLKGREIEPSTSAETT